MWDSSRNNFERNLAVVIGINNYQNGIHKLSTAVNDAIALADLLETGYNYQEVIRLFPPHGEATLESLKKLLSETLPKEIKPTEGDRLLFYFAGHGIARNSEDGPAGYLIPQDAQLGKLETFLPMRDLNTALSQLECHHLLVMLDCCFAGNFRWSSSRNVIPVPETIHREHYDRFIRCPAWQAITSAAHNQEAIDFLSDLRDGANNSHHSPFALALIEGLKDIKADLTGDGVITAPELYLYLRDRLLSKDGYSELQTPGLWPLQKHDRGEFIFTPPGFQREQLKPAPPLNENNNPYRGLQPYDEKHARFFFGRQELIEELYNKISTSAQSSSQLIAVLGISGSGKSSLVKAGLIPYLRKHHEKEWQILEPMRPGKSPFIALASTILAIANVSSDVNNHYFKQLVRGLKKGDSQQLINIIKTWSQANLQVKVLLTIDQCEELITMSRKASSANSYTKSDSIKQKPQDLLSKVFSRQSTAKTNNQPAQKDEIQQEWQQFLVLLINTLKNCPQLHIVLTLRSDFEARFVESALKEYWDKARFPVRTMRSDELREAIEKPASEMALYFEPANAVDRLIDEVGEMPGALPLLSFTLSEFYIKLHQAWSEKRKEDRAVTVDEQFYQQGGIAGSLTYRANQIYDGLPGNAHRDTMRRVMLRMVGIQGGEAVRRQVPESELVYTDRQENKRVKDVIKSLVDARLVVKGQETGEPYAEPAHDFLVRGWDELQEWIKKDQQILSLQQRLTPAALEWKSKQDPRFLWNADPYLDVLKNVLNSTNNWFNQVETEFVKLSIQRRENNRRIRKGLITAAFVIVSGFAYIQWHQNQEAQSRNLATSSEEFFLTDQQIEGLVEAIKAGKKLKLVVRPQADTYNQVVTAIHHGVYDIRERNRLQGHSAMVASLSFNPKHKILASGSRDGTVKLWSLDGHLLKTLNSNTSGISAVSFNPDGTIIASGSRDGVIQLSGIDGKLILNLKGHTKEINNISFSRDGTIFASVSDDSTVKLWSLDGNLITTLQGHDAEVLSLSFSPKDRVLVSGSRDGTMKIWGLDGALIRTIQDNSRVGINTNSFSSVSFSPNGQMLLSGNDNGNIQLWDLNGNLIKSLQGEQGWISRVVFSPNGNTFASAGWDGSVKFWRLGNENPILTLQAHRGERDAQINSLSFSSDGTMLASGSADTTIKLWSLDSEQLNILQAGQNKINTINFSSDSRTIASGSEDGIINIWTVEGKLTSTLQGHTKKVNSVVFSPNGKILASASRDGTIKLWSLHDNKLLKTLYKHKSGVNSLSFSPDSKMLASGGDDQSIVLWSIENGQVLKTFQGHTNLVRNVNFTPDGKNLVSLSKDQTIKLWSLETGKEIWTYRERSYGFMQLSVSSDSKLIAAVGINGTIKLFNLDGHEIRTINHNYGNRDGSGVSSISFNPNNKSLASGSYDSLKLWTLEGRELGTLEIDRKPANIVNVSFSPNGKILASTHDEGIIILWNFDLDNLLARGCNLARAYLKTNPNVAESDRHLCDGIGNSSP